MNETPIRTAGQDDIEAVIAVLLLAFSADPPLRTLFRSAASHTARFPAFAMAFGGAAFAHGSAYVAGDGEAAALWLPPGVEPDHEALGKIVAEALAESGRSPGGDVGERMAAVHPREPHWYLPLIGVDPARQGRGLGSALLRHSLARCDADHLPAYLESSNIKNVPLYERCGFEVVTVIESPDFPPIWPMLRPAR